MRKECLEEHRKRQSFVSISKSPDDSLNTRPLPEGAGCRVPKSEGRPHRSWHPRLVGMAAVPGSALLTRRPLPTDSGFCYGRTLLWVQSQGRVSLARVETGGTNLSEKIPVPARHRDADTCHSEATFIKLRLRMCLRWTALKHCSLSPRSHDSCHHVTDREKF